MSNQSDPINDPPEAVLKFLSQRSRLDHNGAVFFADDDGSPILNFHAPGVPNADVRAAARWTRQYRPDLWEKPKSEAETAADQTPAADLTTMGGVMLALKAGAITDAQADDAIGALSARSVRQYAPVPYRPATTADLNPQSVSARMVAAKNDPAAMAALNAALGMK